MKKINNYISLNLEIGKKIPFWTQAAGGNVSYYDSETDRLWIKPSGYRLDQILELSDVANFQVRDLDQQMEELLFDESKSKDQIESEYSKMLKQLQVTSSGKLLRPSMETAFHLVLPSDWVIHFHSLAAVLMAHQNRVNQKKFAYWLETQGLDSSRIAFVGDVDPGCECAKVLTHYKSAPIIVLSHHGLILQGVDFSIFQQWKKIELGFYAHFYPEKSALFDSSLSSAFSELRKHKFSKELKIFFPDTAVYYFELKNRFIKDNSEIYFNLDSVDFSSEDPNRNLNELWLATLLLQYFEPKLESLPMDSVARLNKMPTESFRKMMR